MLSAFLGVVIILHNPVFNGERCGSSVMTIGSPLGSQPPRHKDGDTVIRIDRVLWHNRHAGYVFTNADGQRYYSAIAGLQARDIRNAELAFMKANASPSIRSNLPDIEWASPYFLPYRGVVPTGYKVQLCVAADLRGH